MPELDDDGRPLTPEGVTAWWKTWGLDHGAARNSRAAAYAKQRAETMKIYEERTNGNPAPEPGKRSAG
jgi:hypothetical protein